MEGKVFGRLTCLQQHTVRRRNKYWCGTYQCDCGNTVVCRNDHVRSGRTQSCGCLYQEAAKQRSNAHGMSNTPEHNSWCSMKARCTNPNNHKYPDYGGRGITICERWLNSFEAFLEDMGTKPGPGYSIDRIDNSGNYEPGNCRWATAKQQARNRRSSRIIEYNGHSKSLAAWAVDLGLNYQTLQLRIARGLSTEEVLFQGHLKDYYKGKGIVDEA